MGADIPVLSQRYGDRKSTRLNSSHPSISYAVFCLKKKMRLALEVEVIQPHHRLAGDQSLSRRVALMLAANELDLDRVVLLFYFEECEGPGQLHPFPTRRSSD